MEVLSLKPLSIREWLDDNISYLRWIKDNARFEHIHYDQVNNQMFGGKAKDCPLSSCKYERWRMQQLQEHYMKDYNGG
jgi:hypothetical protein